MIAARENALWRRARIDGVREELLCVRGERNSLRRRNVKQLKAEKDDIYRAVKIINAMESLKVLPVRYEQFLVGNEA